LDLLAMLYHDIGKLEQAISILQESKLLSRKCHIPFAGRDVLRDYLAEQEHRANGKNLSRRRYAPVV
jgi:hypothetical protein